MTREQAEGNGLVEAFTGALAVVTTEGQERADATDALVEQLKRLPTQALLELTDAAEGLWSAARWEKAQRSPGDPGPRA